MASEHGLNRLLKKSVHAVILSEAKDLLVTWQQPLGFRMTIVLFSVTCEAVART
jgi:hypothetical protein